MDTGALFLVMRKDTSIFLAKQVLKGNLRAEGGTTRG